MSRSHTARRKARRRATSAEREAEKPDRSERLRPITLLPLLAIVAILAVTALIGFGGTSNGMTHAEAQAQVATLLADIPQHENVLGSQDAPLTLEMFADLECPTVKAFAETYLPTLIDTWVRPGALRIEYRPLETDTLDEDVFFAQEEATLAAGRQGRLWNYALTFLYEQQPHYTGYATSQFFAGIAAQVPHLNPVLWKRARPDPLLTSEVIDSVHYARSHETRFTPSFFIVRTPSPSAKRNALVDPNSVLPKVVFFLEGAIGALKQEIGQDEPTLRAFSALTRTG